MSQLFTEYINRLRPKNRVYLVKNNSRFFNGHENPFEKGLVPFMGDILDEKEHTSLDVHESGNRSIIFKKNGEWIKAKGIGIPDSFTRPIMRLQQIYTYQLYDDPGMCHKNILWGLMHESEYNCELYGYRIAQHLGQRIELLGVTCFNDVKCIAFKDRMEMLAKLPKLSREKLINKFMNEKNKIKAYSVYAKVPTDIRVGELFYAFMFPELMDMIDPVMLQDYVKWLGFSCGRLLRDFHDVNTLHGTWTDSNTTSLGLIDVHTNAYTGNYLVDEVGITMCDFDLSNPVGNEKMKEIEKWALVNVENPLHYAGSNTPEDAIEQGIAKKNPFREKIAYIFKKSVDGGYANKLYELEKNQKRECLKQLIKSKYLLWELYELPSNLTGKIDYIDFIVAHKKIDRRKRLEIMKKIN